MNLFTWISEVKVFETWRMGRGCHFNKATVILERKCTAMFF